MSKQFNDLTNKQFGRLTVIEKTDRRISKSIVWLCQCQCGNTKEINGAHLTHGKTTSCGCLNKEITSSRCSLDLSGKRFGRLLVLSKTNKPSYGGGIVWNCICDCGTNKEVSRVHLIDGHTKSCGCLNSELGKERHRQYRISIGASPNIHLSSLDEQVRGELSKSGTKQQILQRDNFKCVLCLTHDNLHVHHIITKSQDISKFFDKSNMITLCKACHLVAHDGSNRRINVGIQRILLRIVANFNSI